MRIFYLIPAIATLLTFSTATAVQAKETLYAISISESARFRQQSADLLALLQQKNFAELQDQMEIEFLKPTLPSDGKNRFGKHIETWWEDETINQWIFPYLDAWVAAYPLSTLPLTARGISQYEQAYIERGTGWAATVSKEHFAKMYDHLKLARADLEKAVNMNPKNPAAWENLIYMSVFFSNEKNSVAKKYFKHAQKYVPDYYFIYTGFQKSLQQRWGGTLLDMKLFLIEHTQTEDETSRMPALIIRAIMDHANLSEVIDKAIEKEYADAPLKEFFIKKILGTQKEQQFYSNPETWNIISGILEKIIQHNPQLIATKSAYADLAVKGGKTDIAEQQYKQIIAIDPGYNPYNLVNLGHIYQEREQYEEALEYYKMANKIFPKHRRVLGKLGYTYTLLERWPESVEAYKTYTILYPEKNGWANLCSSLARVKKYKEAHAACDRSITVAPTDPWALHLKGWIYTWQGNKKLGQSYIKKAKDMGWKG